MNSDGDEANSSSSFGSKSSSPMLTKFESKSNRVKGLSFHPTRTWILAALHNGEIQLWDYVMSSLVNRFVEHEGPVRGVNFHRTQPLFVSGGDDYLIKVWDYKLRRCLFTLQGHLDYIRTVEFHHEIPWIVSASDDQTVRIWNWQSRESIAVLTGHNHYCMSASFHPKEDLVVSASLDQTVRVWDTSGLRRKLTSAKTESSSSLHATGGGGGSLASMGGVVGANSSGEALVKFVLEGHERGVNWAMFHPTQPYIVTGADDRQVRLWRMNDQKAWQVGPMRGHTNNVSCVVFHPKFDLILSNSEDRTIKVWDLNKRTCVKTYRRDSDRFWILTSHPSRSLFAAGHDNGLLVFKLERERPAFDCFQHALYRCKEGMIRMNDQAALCSISRDLIQQERKDMAVRHLMHPHSLQVNKLNNASVDLLVCGPSPFVELIQLSSSKQEPQSRVFPGLCAVFCAKNRFVILEPQSDASTLLVIKNFSGETVKKFAPQSQTDWMFPGGLLSGRVILRAEDRVTLFDLSSQRVIHEVSASKIKSVAWAENFVCLLSKRHVVICTRELEHCCTVSESVRVKSAIWVDNVLLYSTLKHIKYMLPNGDIGVLRSLDEPIYMVQMINSDTLSVLDRDGQVINLHLDLTECRFKNALAQGNYREVMEMIKSKQLVGEAVVGYLEDKGYPEVALRFVKDDATSFSLAVECGQLAVARECAERLQDDAAWQRLGMESLKLGEVKLAELCMQKTRDLSRLSFLYVTLGNVENLTKMQMIAERTKDLDSRMHVALFRDDVKERIRVLEQCGQLALAFVLARVNAMEEDVERLRAKLEEQKIVVEYDASHAPLNSKLSPLFTEVLQTWPLKDSIQASSQAKMEAAAAQQQQYLQQSVAEGGSMEESSATTMELRQVEPEEEEEDESEEVGGGGAWDAEEDEIDLSDDEGDDDKGLSTVPTSVVVTEVDNASAIFSTCSRGASWESKWIATSTLAADHVVAGSFETAMRLLNRQIGVVNFVPLKRAFLQIRASAKTYVMGPPPVTFSHLAVYPHNAQHFPVPVHTLEFVKLKLPLCYDLFSKAKFDECAVEFTTLLQILPLVVCTSTDQVMELGQIKSICREYIVAIRLKQASDESVDDVKRQVELIAYCTRRDLLSQHLLLVAKVAMVKAFKLENYITAAHFAKRILALPGVDQNAKLKQDAQKVLQKSEREGRNALELNYSDSPFELDVVSMAPMVGSGGKRCPFCEATSADQILCPVCDLSRIGVETLGLVSMVSNRQ